MSVDSGSERGVVDNWRKKRGQIMLWVQNVVGFLIVVGFGYYLWMNRAQFSSFPDLSPFDVVLILTLILCSWLFSAAQGFVLYRAMDIPIRFSESFFLLMAATFGNYLPARAGTLIRAHYLKSLHGLRYARFGSISIIRTILTVITAGLFGLGATLWLSVSGGEFSIQLLGFFALLVLAPSLALVLRVRIKPNRVTQNWLAGRWRDFIMGFQQLRARPGVSVKIIVFLLLQYIALGARFYVAARITGDSLPLAVIALLAPLAALMNYISFTPGALGAREAIMGYAAFAAGSSFSQGLFVGTVDRAVLLVLVAIIGGPSFAWVWARVKRGVRQTE